jgi:5-methylcytosine-specific restriction protein B
MPSLPVDAVFFARYTASNYRALYRRFPGPPKTYTKDYFQLADQAENVLISALGYTGTPVPIEYVWPGGTRAGELRFSSDRVHLSWPTGGPQAWRVGDTADGVTSISGDPAKASIDEAEAEYERIKALGHEPWLVGVLLVDQPKKIHVRVYFDNPPAGFEGRKVGDLPGQVQSAIASVSANAGTGALKAARSAPLPRAAALVQEIEQALARNPNVLLIGPPGTGKTVALEDLFEKYAASGAPLYFDTDSWDATAFTEGPAPEEQRSETLVFHPSYSYENFVAGLYPKAGENGGVELEAVPGPLLRLGHWIGRSGRQALLILDEFNRGSAAAIFGDTLGLLDKDKRTSLNKRGAYIQRPYPDFPMGVSDDYAAYGDTSKDIPKQISLPSGLSIVAAMNSTDRSVAPLDAALRRRFHVIRVQPDYEVLAQRFGLAPIDVADLVLPVVGDPTAWERKHVLILAVRALKAINDRVRFCLGDDFLLGHALLWGLAESTETTALADLATAMDGFVISTLRTTFLDQDDVLAAVLAIPDGTAKPATSALAWVPGYWQGPPNGLDKIASRRLVLHSLGTLPAEAQLSCLAKLAAP